MEEQDLYFVGQKITAPRRVPMMSAPGSDEFIKGLPAGTEVMVMEVSLVRLTEWLKVKVTGPNEKDLGEGWINSIAVT